MNLKRVLSFKKSFTTINSYQYFMGKYLKKSLYYMSLMVASGLLELAGLLMLIPLLNQSDSNSEKEKLFIVLILFLFLGLSSTFRRLGDFLSAKIKCEIEFEQRSFLLSGILGAPWKSVSRLDQSDLDTTLTSEISQAVNGYVGLVAWIPNLVVTSIMFLSTFTINPALTGFSIVLGFIAFVFSRTEARKQKASQIDLSEEYLRLNREISSLIVNLKFLRSSGYQSNFHSIAIENFRRIAGLIFSSMNSPSKARWITDMSGISLLFFVLTYSVMTSNSITNSLVFIAILFRLTPKLQGLQSGWIMVSQQSIWMKRWSEQIEFFTNSREPSLPRENNVSKISCESNLIEFTDVFVNFSEREKAALSNVSLKIAIGERVALVGKSGSGKSTFIDLLTGVMQPDQGIVKVRGQQLTASNAEDWKRQIAWTPQTPALRTGTIEDNLKWLHEHVSQESMLLGLRVSELTYFVQQLPSGMHQEINPKSELSGGQAQRLALARAVARKPLLLILDEATSSLDEDLELKIIANLSQLDCGLILATHRPNPLTICTRTIEFVEGKIAFDGSTKDYLSRHASQGDAL